MDAKVIKNETAYEAALARLSALMDLDPAPGSPDADELELLAVLIREWEARSVPAARPDPIDAILFRMEQAGLNRKDLVPFIGSLARVSEVLGRKRPLSIAMMRRLHHGLGIPADVLLGSEEAEVAAPAAADESELDYSRLPLREMAARGYFGAVKGGVKRLKEEAQSLLRRSFGELLTDKTSPLLLRAPMHQRGNKRLDPYALAAWRMIVVKKARSATLEGQYERGVVNESWLRDLARLSAFRDGPRLAVEHLSRHGIALVFEPHFPRTFLDGAVLIHDGTPIVALTLRHDRLDNFWFVLMHELAHLALHLRDGDVIFVDNLDEPDASDDVEREADRLASDALIPPAAWNAAPVRRTLAAADALALARELRISPAIVAGRLRHETRNFRLMTKLVGHGLVITALS